MKNTILRKKQHLAKREKKNGKSIKFKRGRNVSRKSEAFTISRSRAVRKGMW